MDKPAQNGRLLNAFLLLVRNVPILLTGRRCCQTTTYYFFITVIDKGNALLSPVFDHMVAVKRAHSVHTHTHTRTHTHAHTHTHTHTNQLLSREAYLHLSDLHPRHRLIKRACKSTHAQTHPVHGTRSQQAHLILATREQASSTLTFLQQ